MRGRILASSCGAGPDGAIQAGLAELVSTYLARDFKRGAGLLRIERLLVDMGYKPGIVAAVKHKCGGATMMLSKGLGIRAASRPISGRAARRTTPARGDSHPWAAPEQARIHPPGHQSHGSGISPKRLFRNAYISIKARLSCLHDGCRLLGSDLLT